MFFDKEYQPNIIEDITIDELEERVGVTDRPYSLDMPCNQWAWFSYLKGKEAGLNDMYCVNFGYYTSSFIAGMGVDAGTDIYFKESWDNKVFDLYEDCRNNTEKEEDCVKQFWHRLLNMYHGKDGAFEHEKAVFQHNIRVTPEVKEYFDQCITTTVGTILGFVRKPHSIPRGTGKKTKNLNFQFTYTQEWFWEGLPGDNDSEKLEGLIHGEQT